MSYVPLLSFYFCSFLDSLFFFYDYFWSFFLVFTVLQCHCDRSRFRQIFILSCVLCFFSLRNHVIQKFRKIVSHYFFHYILSSFLCLSLKLIVLPFAIIMLCPVILAIILTVSSSPLLTVLLLIYSKCERSLVFFFFFTFLFTFYCFNRALRTLWYE